MQSVTIAICVQALVEQIRRSVVPSCPRGLCASLEDRFNRETKFLADLDLKIGPFSHAFSGHWHGRTYDG